MLNKPAHPTHPSLLPLRIALTLAESASPARPRRLNRDERLALQLIARMQARYKKARPFLAQSLLVGEKQHER